MLVSGLSEEPGLARDNPSRHKEKKQTQVVLSLSHSHQRGLRKHPSYSRRYSWLKAADTYLKRLNSPAYLRPLTAALNKRWQTHYSHAVATGSQDVAGKARSWFMSFAGVIWRCIDRHEEVLFLPSHLLTTARWEVRGQWVRCAAASPEAASIQGPNVDNGAGGDTWMLFGWRRSYCGDTLLRPFCWSWRKGTMIFISTGRREEWEIILYGCPSGQGGVFRLFWWTRLFPLEYWIMEELHSLAEHKLLSLWKWKHNTNLLYNKYMYKYMWG